LTARHTLLRCVVRKTRSVLDRNLICFIITPPQQLNSPPSSFFLVTHIHLPPRALVDCGVVEVGDLAVRSNLSARSQIMTSILPPPHRKIRPKSPGKKNAATPSPGRSSPRPRVHLLIVVSLRLTTRRCGLIRPPGRKLRPLSYPPPSKKIHQNPLKITKLPRHPPAVSAPAPTCAR
jgi:hypothetical protein